MPEVPVTINGRVYRIACGPGEEERLSGLAQDLDKRVQGFVRSFGQVGEGQLLALAALMLADELADASGERSQLTARIAQIENAADDAARAADREAAGVLDALAQRIEAIATRLEQP